VLDSLPVGGARGTIEGIAGTPAAGRVFAKTGSMMHVRGLAGYLATARHGAVTFAFEVDDWNGDYPSLAALRAKVLSRIVSD
jgi:D-alanyl-D-alanine carboxypeptidase/D-alanyl-D-alanine-endopeptidase (penicillin-binding protein 4)